LYQILRRGRNYEKIKELSEINESIKNLFDDEFLAKLIKERGSNIIKKILEEDDKEFLDNLFLEKFRNDKEFRGKIKKELEKDIK
jgi:hypothetical protein